MMLPTKGTWQRVARVVVEEKMVAMVSSFGRSDSMRMALYLLLPIVSVSFYAEIKAASFDCEKAKSAVEKMICANAELSRLDEELADVYKTTLAVSTTGTIKDIQNDWLKARNHCKDEACLKSSYGQQITVLRQSTPIVSGSPTQALDLSDTAMISHTNCPEPKIDWRNYEWTLIVGSGRTSCEEMLAYLKSRPRDQPPPVCAEERLPPNANWTRPAWQEVSEAQRQRFLDKMPDNKNPSTQSRVKLFQKGKLMTAYTDMSGDGVPEHILALSSSYAYEEGSPPISRIYSKEAWEDRCRLSTRCAHPKGDFRGQILLRDESPGELLPLNSDGTDIDWEHQAVKGRSGFVFGTGELIHFKKRPYWLSRISWWQKWHDDFTRYASNPNDHLANIFYLGPLLSGKINSKNRPEEREEPKPFDQVTDFYTSDKTNCYFGYFHRENLKRNPPQKGR